MGQINFIRDVIGENLSLGAQFELNCEDWNFRGPNLIFTKSNDSNRGNHKKIIVLESIRVSIEDIYNQWPFLKRRWTMRI
jgi:hypothetical protein